MIESAKVSDVMVKKVITTGPKMKIYEAARLMREQNTYSLPVTEENRLIGIITARDIVRRIIADRKRYEDALVEEHMTREVITSSPDESVSVASKKMHTHKVGQLPVLEGVRIVGMLSQMDIIQSYPSYFKLKQRDRRWTIEHGPITTRLGYR